jgi:ComF family protein
LLKYIVLIKKSLKFLLEIIFYQNFDLNKLQENIPRVNWRIFEKTFYCFDYKREIIKEAIWQIKFKNNKNVCILFADTLANKIKGLEIDNFILIPIPIHKKRRQERGFNQCERLCEEIIRKISKQNFRYEKNLLIRTRYTEKQSWNNKKDRENNLKEVFEINKNLKQNIYNKKVILIDDVITTGSTIKEASRTLLESGASEVISICIAH